MSRGDTTAAPEQRVTTELRSEVQTREIKLNIYKGDTEQVCTVGLMVSVTAGQTAMMSTDLQSHSQRVCLGATVPHVGLDELKDVHGLLLHRPV